ncbi:phosphoglycerate kinase [bacterium]|nr:phosphoglycerate kinase [bacterium]
MAKMTIKDITLRNKVLMRVDFNVPLNEKREITDTTRIERVLPTIKYLLEKNCSLILMSHLGRPKGKVVSALSLAPVAIKLEELLGQKVLMASDCIGGEVESVVNNLKPGEIILLENLRFHPEEEKNDEVFASQLAALGDIFIQDAFGTVHRAHASTAGICKFLPSAAGFLLEKEIKFLDNALQKPARPFLAILGGAKVSDKIAVIDSLLNKVDSLLIGGAMAYTFLEAQGIKTGKSLVEKDKIDLAGKLLKKAERENVVFLLPTDHVIAEEISETAETKVSQEIEIPDQWMGVDIGPITIRRYKAIIKEAKTIIWNGPMGIFENEKFAAGTMQIAQAIGEVTQEGVISIVGGGDSVAAVEKAGVSDKLSHISTGGGASLELLEGKELPGIAALQEKE